MFIFSLVLCQVTPSFAESSSEPMDMIGNTAAIPTRVSGVAAGMLLGCPIAALRYSLKNYVNYTEVSADKVGSKIGGKDNGPTCAVVSLATLPAGVVVGSLQGVYYGTKNAFTHGFNEPFNADSFTLGSLDEK